LQQFDGKLGGSRFQGAFPVGGPGGDAFGQA
jgi:hypothetical protein